MTSKYDSKRYLYRSQIAAQWGEETPSQRHTSPSWLRPLEPTRLLLSGNNTVVYYPTMNKAYMLTVCNIGGLLCQLPPPLSHLAND